MPVMFNFGAPLFWYKIIFVAELLTTETLTTYSLKKQRYFFIRTGLCVTGLFAAAFMFPIFAFNAFYSTFMFLTLFCLSLLCLKICYKEPWKNLVFCGVLSYTTQHISYEIYSLILKVTDFSLFSNFGNSFEPYGDISAGIMERAGWYRFFVIILQVGIDAIVYWFMWAFVARRIRMQEDFKVTNKALIILAAVIVLVDIVLNAFIVYGSREKYALMPVIVFQIANIINCALAIGLQFYQLSNKLLLKELETVHGLWYQDKLTYELSRENIELINLKCHDLRKQIRAIRKSDGEVDRSALKEIEKAVRLYDSVVKTGNKALDVILSEKSLFCEKNSIKMLCIVDGRKLDFISAWDLYSLFENAVQNAIDAVIQLDDTEKRIIRINAVGVSDMLSVHIENFYDKNRKLSFVNGLPQTTKGDKRYHGYGIRSMQMLAEKYNGALSVSVQDDTFNLNIMIPMQS